MPAPNSQYEKRSYRHYRRQQNWPATRKNAKLFFKYRAYCSRDARQLPSESWLFGVGLCFASFGFAQVFTPVLRLEAKVEQPNEDCCDRKSKRLNSSHRT